MSYQIAGSPFSGKEERHAAERKSGVVKRNLDVDAVFPLRGNGNAARQTASSSSSSTIFTILKEEDCSNSTKN